jgi:hypothetical protein
MVVKIDTYYTAEEVRELCTCLVLSGLVSQQEMIEATPFFDGLEINFFSINDLLLPFLKKFVSYSKEERDSFWHSNDSSTFYENLTRRLLQGSPLHALNPICFRNRKSRELITQAGSLIEQFHFDTHPGYLVRVIDSINHLLKQHGFDSAYYEVEFDEDTAFLLLSEANYQFLIINRVLNFARLDYPEIELWRKSLRLEDLPF